MDCLQGLISNSFELSQWSIMMLSDTRPNSIAVVLSTTSRDRQKSFVVLGQIDSHLLDHPWWLLCCNEHVYNDSAEAHNEVIIVGTTTWGSHTESVDQIRSQSFSICICDKVWLSRFSARPKWLLSLLMISGDAGEAHSFFEGTTPNIHRVKLSKLFVFRVFSFVALVGLAAERMEMQ